MGGRLLPSRADSSKERAIDDRLRAEDAGGWAHEHRQRQGLRTRERGRGCEPTARGARAWLGMHVVVTEPAGQLRQLCWQRGHEDAQRRDNLRALEREYQCWGGRHGLVLWGAAAR